MIKYSSTFAGVRYVSEGTAEFPARVEVAKTTSGVGTLGTYSCGQWKPAGVTVTCKGDIEEYESSLW